MKKHSTLALLVILPVLTYFGGFFHAASLQSLAMPELPEAVDPSAELDLAQFFQVWRLVEQKYVDAGELTPEDFLYGAVKGVVGATHDPFSEFLTPTESDELMSSLEGSLTGIGAEVGIRDEVLTIISPLRGSPAEEAGLLPGDRVFKIDGIFAADYSLFEAVQNIRGEAGTQVTLSIIRGEELDPREIVITRDFIDIESVVVDERDEDIAIITVATFADDTATEFAAALRDLADNNISGLVVDLRFNGGGYLDAAVEMVSGLLATGDVVEIRERGLPPQRLPVLGGVILPDVPLVVLINEGSASASEIMAGALQDAGRATVVGEQSFGKGTVQELIDGFEDGSLLRVTVAKFFTPAGRDVTEDAIVPDEIVDMTGEDFLAGRDPQLDRAIEILTEAQ